MMRTLKKMAIGTLLLAVLLPSLPLPAEAQATGALYLSPSSGKYNIGATFTVTVRVNTGGQPINAADGFISFDPSQVSVVGVSRGGSIFNLWTSEPAFSNSAGSISFSGGTPTPYSGNGGAIMTATFRALREATSTIRFQAGSILAADGKGTNIVGSLGSGVYTFGAVQVTPPPPAAPLPNTPGAPTVQSDTHPDQNAWYTNSNVHVTWSGAAGITGVRTLLNQSATSTPTQVQSSSLREATLESLDDGVWYYHVQLRNGEGWGGVAHFRIQIDTTDPSSFEVVEIQRDDLTQPRVSFELRDEDETSGVAYYDVQIDGGEAIRYEDPEGTNIYTTNPLGPGTHTIIITAFDAAGNSAVDSDQFSIVAIGPPEILEYTEQLRTSDIFVARGATFQNATVIITLTPSDGGEPVVGETTSGVDGLFTFVLDEKLAEGAWKLTAVVRDSRGAMSHPTDELPVIVGPSFLREAGEKTIDFLSIVIAVLGTMFLFGFLIWYGWHRFRMFLGVIEEETKETESILHRQFDALRASTKEKIAMLEHAGKRRSLTKEEERIVEELKHDLDEAEKAILQELEELEQDILEEEHPLKKLMRRLMRSRK